MNDWSSFGAEKLLTDAWRQFLLEQSPSVPIRSASAGTLRKIGSKYGIPGGKLSQPGIEEPQTPEEREQLRDLSALINAVLSSKSVKEFLENYLKLMQASVDGDAAAADTVANAEEVLPDAIKKLQKIALSAIKEAADAGKPAAAAGQIFLRDPDTKGHIENFSNWGTGKIRPYLFGLLMREAYIQYQSTRPLPSKVDAEWEDEDGDGIPDPPAKEESPIKYSLPNNWWVGQSERVRTIYSELLRIYNSQYERQSFRKDLIELVQLLAPHSGVIQVRPVAEQKRSNRLIRMMSNTNAPKGSEEASRTMGALKAAVANNNQAIERILGTMISYKGRPGGHQIGDDLRHFIGALMTSAQAVDISGRQSKKTAGAQPKAAPKQSSADPPEPLRQAAEGLENNVGKDILQEEKLFNRWKIIAGLREET